MDADEAAELRAKCPRFRALIIGRANAGKTTILKAICNSTDEPRVYGPYNWKEGTREKIDTDIVSPSMERGDHDINNELVFSSNDGFVFHDSRGFESGSTAEVESMKRFIEERADARSLDQKLHAIWYCIPTDNARLLTMAELEFFDNCDPKGVPVIMIFTKFDSLDAIAFNQLEEEGLSFEEAEAKAPQYAEEVFSKTQLPRIWNQKYPPAKVVYLRDMHKNGKYEKIIELTTETLSSETLKMLLVSVQKTNLTYCISYALKSKKVRQQMKEYAHGKEVANVTKKQMDSIMRWFTHTWVYDVDVYLLDNQYDQLDLHINQYDQYDYDFNYRQYDVYDFNYRNQVVMIAYLHHEHDLSFRLRHQSHVTKIPSMTSLVQDIHPSPSFTTPSTRTALHSHAQHCTATVTSSPRFMTITTLEPTPPHEVISEHSSDSCLHLIGR